MFETTQSCSPKAGPSRAAPESNFPFVCHTLAINYPWGDPNFITSLLAGLRHRLDTAYYTFTFTKNWEGCLSNFIIYRKPHIDYKEVVRAANDGSRHSNAATQIPWVAICFSAILCVPRDNHGGCQFCCKQCINREGSWGLGHS
jgi:hypothetical protein